MSLQIRSLAVAIASISSLSAYGAGLDRSTQPSQYMMESGTYAQIEYVTIDADVSGKDCGSPAVSANGNTAGCNYANGREVKDMVGDYHFVNFAVKTDINDKYSIGVYYDQPWGADVKHPDGQSNNFVNQTTGEGTSAKVRSQNISTILGTKFAIGDKKYLHVYGGPAFEKKTSELHLRGNAYTVVNGYDSISSNSSAWGWVAGVGYSNPMKGQRIALTYRSEIDHESSLYECNTGNPLYSVTQFCATTPNFKGTSPESFNLDFQTALNRTTLLSGKVRYVGWSDYKSYPPYYSNISGTLTGTALPILTYNDDAWSGELILGKALNPKISVSGSIGFDTGTGEYAGSTGPVNGFYSVGLGGRYNFNKNWAVAVGAKYLKFGDAWAELPNKGIVGRFEDNDAIVYGMRLQYKR